MKNKNIGLMTVHLAVLLFGLSGLFGKLITLPAIIITLGRVFFSSLFLLCLLKVRKVSLKPQSRLDAVVLASAGAVLALHWWSFLASIQVSTVATATISFSTFPLFVTLLSPFFSKEKILSKDIFSACLMMAGVFIMIESWDFGESGTLGVFLGLLSAVTYAFLSLINRNFSQKYPSAFISFFEQGFACLFLLPSLFIVRPTFDFKNIMLLFVLGVIFTGISHTLFISGLKSVKPQTAGIISGLETIYSIVFAFLLFREIPSAREVMGGAVILGVVFYTTLRAKNEK